MIKIFFSLVAFCIYYLLVQFGSIFTISFGFASAIWPLSGVILGLYFLYGRSILVGSFLASLLTLQQESLFADLPSYVIFILASISVLQFIIAKQLVVRFCTLPLNIRKLVSIVKFLLLTGPLTVLMSTSLFALTLTLSLDIPWQTLTYISLVKFVGDLLSILFIAPIFLFLKTNFFVLKTKHSLAAALISLLSFSLISSIYILASNSDFALKEREFADSTEPFIEKFNVFKTTMENNITALNGLFQASEEVTRLEFETYANKLINDEFNVIALAWLPLISHQKRKKFEAELAYQGFANTRIKKKTEQGLIISPNKSFYLPLYYISNLDANKSAVGLDALSHPILNDIVDKMIKEEKQIITPLVYLTQHQDKYTADLYYPIYKNSHPEHITVLQGLVKVNFELNILLSDLHRNMKANTFTYQLKFGDNNVVTHPDFKVNSIFSHQYGVNILDKKGQLSFASTPEFELSLINWQILIIMMFGSIIGIICVSFVFFIITFNSSLKRKIREKTTELIKKNKELTSANQAKNLFLANISHEYRTPLNAIMGFSEIALRDIKDKHALDYFAKIEASSKILLSIVNDVLDASKMQAGEINLESRRFSPSAVTQSVIDMLIEKASNKSITVNKNFTSNFDLYVKGDDTRFKQIIINLLNNAIKFTDKGSINISGDSIYDTDDETSILTIVIRDTGIGIDKEDQEHLFTPFIQATSTTTRQHGGTGLGLAIVKNLCSLMGGNVTLISQLDMGSTFTVTITLPTTEEPIEVSSSTLILSKYSHYKKAKILVVEDNKINQLIVNKQLDFQGITCDFADDGLLALSYLENTTPDLILMDLQMPNMDGFTAASLIKENRKLQNIPIVILSASVSNEDKEQASILGIDDFISKPCYQEDLVAILDKYLKASINTTD